MNPYQKTLTDEASGMEVPNVRWEAWEAGRKAGIGEVVGFADSPCTVRTHIRFGQDHNSCSICWRAKLKEWGV